MNQALSSQHARFIAFWQADRVKAALHDAIALGSRFALAGIFFLSGRTKVDEHFRVTEGAVALFAEEYNLPLIDPSLAAHAAAYAEHLFPMLLALGLLTRFSALSLLGMTAVIQFFVYPDAWPTHLSWAALAAYLLAHGAGRPSVDALIRHLRS